jgi:EmrB/QacA subfamily drug resistance transporter
MPLISRISDADVHRRRWQLLALTSVGAFMAPLDGSIVSVALPVIGKDLNLSFTAAVWVSAAFLLTTAVMLIPAGRIADQHGRVRYYLLGIGVFTVASALCAASMGDTWLITARIIQGVGAAFMGATSAAIVTAVFPPSERGRALGINVMAVYIGLTVGPPLGGFITDAVGWRWIFLINLPVGVIVLLWGWFMLPRSESEGGPSLDWLGSVLLGAFLVCLLVPLTFSVQWGWASPSTIGMLAVSGASFVTFVLHERRTASPILNLDLVLKNRLFAAANTAALLNYMALYGIALLTAIFLELVQGRSASLTGWLLLSQPLLMAALSPSSGHLSDRIGSRVLATGGMVGLAAGMVFLAFMGAATPLWHVVLALVVVGLGMAAFSAPNTSAIMGSVRRDQLSQASAFLSTMRTSGQALSVALLGGIAASQLGAVGGRLLLTHGSGGAVGAHAVDAYVTGYHYAMLAGAALALIGAAVSLTRGAQELEPGAPAH